MKTCGYICMYDDNYGMAWTMQLVEAEKADVLILDCPTGSPVTMFKKRQDAQSAIKRTRDYFTLLRDDEMRATVKLYKIIRVEEATHET